MLIDLTTKVDKDNVMMKEAREHKNRHYIMGHVGTHLDTYKKTDIPMEYFKRDGVLIDVSGFCSTREVELSDLKNIDIPSESFVVFKTLQINKYEYGTNEYFNEHPQLSHEVIEFLCSKNISFIGIDCSGIRRGDEHKDADVFCEDRGVYVIENLSNVDQISEGSFKVYTMWLDDEELTGLRCRVIVEQ